MQINDIFKFSLTSTGMILGMKFFINNKSFSNTKHHQHSSVFQLQFLYFKNTPEIQKAQMLNLMN